MLDQLPIVTADSDTDYVVLQVRGLVVLEVEILLRTYVHEPIYSNRPSLSIDDPPYTQSRRAPPVIGSSSTTDKWNNGGFCRP